MKEAKDKAEELIEKFKDLVQYDYRGDEEPIYSLQVQCALICVDEMLDLMIKKFKWDIKHNGNIDYFQQVKQEILNRQ